MPKFKLTLTMDDRSLATTLYAEGAIFTDTDPEALVRQDVLVKMTDPYARDLPAGNYVYRFNLSATGTCAIGAELAADARENPHPVVAAKDEDRFDRDFPFWVGGTKEPK